MQGLSSSLCFFRVVRRPARWTRDSYMYQGNRVLPDMLWQWNVPGHLTTTHSSARACAKYLR